MLRPRDAAAAALQAAVYVAAAALQAAVYVAAAALQAAVYAAAAALRAAVNNGGQGCGFYITVLKNEVGRD